MKTGDTHGGANTGSEGVEVQDKRAGVDVSSLQAVDISPRTRGLFGEGKNIGGLRPIGHYSSRIVKRLEPKID